MSFLKNMNFYIPVFQLLPDSLIYRKFKRLVVRPQRMTLMAKIMLTISEKSFFTLVN